MKVTVIGKGMDVGDALRSHVEEKLSNVTGKYFDHGIDSTVIFSKERHLFHTTISSHIGRGVMAQGYDSANEAYPSFDLALTRVEKQLRRLKDKFKDRHKETRADEVIPAQQYVLASDRVDSAEKEYESGDAPVVIAEMTTEIPTLTVVEAVQRMDIGGLPAVFFRNRGHGGYNMIYRRADGNIGWVDPRTKA